jgi:FAD:protein FMN transferase
MIPDRFCFVLLCLFATMLTASCGGNHRSSLHKASRVLMGTLVEVTVVGKSDKARSVAHAALDEIARVEDLASFHKSSELARINDMAGISPVKVDAELLKLAQTSLRFAEESDGAFDPTVGAVTCLWHFSGADQPRVPAKDEISRALSKVDWRRVQIDQSAGTVFLPERGMKLDFGGLAKGHALDRVSQLLRATGIQGALVNIGGDILAVGEKNPGRPWRVGVRDPRDAGAIRAVATLTDKVLLTSGDYERFLEVNGERYHHIIDPKTGYAPTELQSVTLLAATGLTAPSAGVFVMGVDKGLRYVDSIPGLAGLLIDLKGNLHLSSEAVGRFEIKQRPTNTLQPTRSTDVAWRFFSEPNDNSVDSARF